MRRHQRFLHSMRKIKQSFFYSKNIYLCYEKLPDKGIPIREFLKNSQLEVKSNYKVYTWIIRKARKSESLPLILR